MKNLEILALATVFFASAAGLIVLALISANPCVESPLLAFTFAALFSMSAKMLITFEK